MNAHQQFDCRTLGFDNTEDHEPWLGVVPNVLGDGLKIHDYAAGRRQMRSRKWDHPVIPCIFTSWDNAARRARDAIVIVNSTPEKFAAGLEEMVVSVADKPRDERIIFINAWNEWAEGMYLEPDLRYGMEYLDRRAAGELPREGRRRRVRRWARIGPPRPR